MFRFLRRSLSLSKIGPHPDPPSDSFYTQSSMPSSKDLDSPMNFPRSRPTLEQGFEISYATSSIVVICYPHEELEINYTSGLKNAAGLLNTKHKHKIKVFNLSQSSEILSSLFNKIDEFHWPKDMAPTLDILISLAKGVQSWIALDPHNISVLHSKGDRSKIALVLKSFSSIIVSSNSSSEIASLEKYIHSRLSNLLTASQERYCQYFTGLLNRSFQLPSKTVFLHGFGFNGLPCNASFETLRIFFKIYDFSGGNVHVSNMFLISHEEKVVCLKLKWPITIKNDFMVKCFRDKNGGRSCIFRCQFSAGDPRIFSMTLPSSELDIPSESADMFPQFSFTLVMSNLASLHSDVKCCDRILLPESIIEDEAFLSNSYGDLGSPTEPKSMDKELDELEDSTVYNDSIMRHLRRTPVADKKVGDKAGSGRLLVDNKTSKPFNVHSTSSFSESSSSYSSPRAKQRKRLQRYSYSEYEASQRDVIEQLSGLEIELNNELLDDEQMSEARSENWDLSTRNGKNKSPENNLTKDYDMADPCLEALSIETSIDNNNSSSAQEPQRENKNNLLKPVISTADRKREFFASMMSETKPVTDKLDSDELLHLINQTKKENVELHASIKQDKDEVDSNANRTIGLSKSLSMSSQRDFEQKTLGNQQQFPSRSSLRGSIAGSERGFSAVLTSNRSVQAYATLTRNQSQAIQDIHQMTKISFSKSLSSENISEKSVQIRSNLLDSMENLRRSMETSLNMQNGEMLTNGFGSKPRFGSDSNISYTERRYANQEGPSSETNAVANLAELGGTFSRLMKSFEHEPNPEELAKYSSELDSAVNSFKSVEVAPARDMTGFEEKQRAIRERQERLNNILSQQPFSRSRRSRNQFRYYNTKQADVNKIHSAPTSPLHIPTRDSSLDSAQRRGLAPPRPVPPVNYYRENRSVSPLSRNYRSERRSPVSFTTDPPISGSQNMNSFPSPFSTSSSPSTRSGRESPLHKTVVEAVLHPELHSGQWNLNVNNTSLGKPQNNPLPTCQTSMFVVPSNVIDDDLSVRSEPIIKRNRSTTTHIPKDLKIPTNISSFDKVYTQNIQQISHQNFRKNSEQAFQNTKSNEVEWKEIDDLIQDLTSYATELSKSKKATSPVVSQHMKPPVRSVSSINSGDLASNHNSPYFSFSNSRSTSLSSDPPVFSPLEYSPMSSMRATESSHLWYRPTMTREEVNSILKLRPPGTFIVRDSYTFSEAYGLALRIPGNLSQEQVKHYLIETTSKGVQLKGSAAEPYFSSLVELIWNHSVHPLSLPCPLLLPGSDMYQDSDNISVTSSVSSTSSQTAAACSVVFINCCFVENLVNETAVAYTMDVSLQQKSTLLQPIVNFKVTRKGIYITDHLRRLFYRKEFPANRIQSVCLEPKNRTWAVCHEQEVNIKRPSKCFGVIVRDLKGFHDCLLFAEYESGQPAAAIVAFITQLYAMN